MDVDAAGHRGSLIYAGIDEAGYGPLLGPLCVALSVFRVNDWQDGEPAPDLWKRLRRAVCDAPAGTKQGLLAIGDSKRLKLSNSSRTQHPLMHLERGILSFLLQLDRDGGTDQALFQSLGTQVCELPWYEGQTIALPLSTTADHVRLMGVKLREACTSHGVALCELQCRVIDEARFNNRLERLRVKSRVAFEVVAELIEHVWRRHASAEMPPRLMIDRQGGRRGYADLLAAILPDADVCSAIETERQSRYELVERAAGDSRRPKRMCIVFQVEAEQKHMPVALASMTAKLARELSMMRFNRYWCGRISELKPTAGYTTDGRRWLQDAGAHLTHFERQALARRA